MPHDSRFPIHDSRPLVIFSPSCWTSTACARGSATFRQWHLSGPTAWGGSDSVYYVTLDFSGTKIYPGGQSAFKKEAQFRIAAPQDSSYFDAGNDWSFQGVSEDPSAPSPNANIPVYREGTLLRGNEPK